MKEGFIFDLDGTVYRSDELMPGARSVITKLDVQGFGIVFLSNKPLHSRQYYADNLDQLGIPVDVNQIITSSYVMGYHLSDTDKGVTVYPVGEEPLMRELKAGGMVISEDPEEIDYVVASFDRNFHYDKLNIAFQAIMNGARFIATNPDRTCPVKNGEVPDAAGMIGAIEGVTGKKVELVTGKPSKLMVKAALDRLELPPGDCLLIGDRLETDIKMGNDHGIPTALVLTGVTNRSDLAGSSIEPTYILEDLSQLPEKLDFEL
ncbi:MAG: HAD-IIA family hydrolase [Candidatus Bipolaricaulota bacterium]